jgi:beta-mannosidase
MANFPTRCCYGIGAYLSSLDEVRRANVGFMSDCLGFANVPNVAAADVSAKVPRDRGADWDFADVTRHYARLLYGADGTKLRRAATAEVMEATLAEWRRAGSSCAGALVWMLKDFMPGSGWRWSIPWRPSSSPGTFFVARSGPCRSL